MKVLIAPLNWGLGHASRCIPLVRRHIEAGDEVVLGGDGDSLLLLRKHFPRLRYLPLAELHLRYSAGTSQVLAMLRALPKLLLFSLQDYLLLRAYQEAEHFDLIISDNRFGLHCPHTRCVYMTHQLRIRLPHGWRWAEGIAHALHARVYHKYTEVWVPDYADEARSLSGWLSHGLPADECVRYIGPLSRHPQALTPPYPPSKVGGTSPSSEGAKWDVVAILSGLEPQRSMLEQEIRRRYADSEERVLIVQGLIGRPATVMTHGPITTVPHLGDAALQQALRGARHIIARSGYSTIMDLAALGLLDRAELIPTPGQPEQEYLAERHNTHT